MAQDRKKVENIITVCVVIFALVLSGIVILVKTGVIGSREDDSTTDTTVEYITESTVIIMSEVDEDGNVSYYSILDYYTRPSVSSNHRYPTTTTTTKPTSSTEEDVSYYIEESSVVQVTNENGEQVTNENGEPVTKITKYTVPSDKNGKTTTETTTETTTQTTSETTTKIIYVTDPISKKPVKNLKGEYIVSGVETEPSTTAPTTASTTKASTTEEVTTKPADSSAN